MQTEATQETTQAVRLYDVYLNGSHIDTVTNISTDADEVKRDLINHDGYSAEIAVYARAGEYPADTETEAKALAAGRPLSKAAQAAARRFKAAEVLKRYYPEGATVYTITAGAFNRYKVLALTYGTPDAIYPQGRPYLENVTVTAARALNLRLNPKDGFIYLTGDLAGSEIARPLAKMLHGSPEALAHKTI